MSAVQLSPGEAGLSRVVVTTMPGTLEVECHHEATARVLARGLAEHYDHVPTAPLPPVRANCQLALQSATRGTWEPLSEVAWRDTDARPQRPGFRPGLAYEHVQEYLADDAPTDDAHAGNVVGTVEFVTRDGSWIRVDHQQQMHGAISPADRARGDSGFRVLRDLVAVAFTRVWRSLGYFVLHCSVVVGPDNHTRLFPASSGNGKSALMLALVRHGGTLVGDDKLILREETTADGSSVIRGYPMQRFVNLTQDVADYLPELAFLRDERSSPTWPKVRIDMSRVGLGDAPLPVCEPDRILFPRVAEGAESSELAPVSNLDALDQLLTQSVVSLEPAHARAHLHLLARLVNDCRCEWLLGGPDVYRSPVEFCEWLIRETE